MNLAELLEGVTAVKMFQMLYGKTVVTEDVAVRGISYDSRTVRPGELFVAIRGTGVDGHRYVAEAIQKGAAVVVVEDDAAVPDSLCLHAGTTKIVVPDSRRALATLSANFYGRPSRRLKMVAVTGTNGKTTTTHLIRGILEAAGERTGLVGTIGYMIGRELIPATHTTPESLELNGLLATMVEQKCTAAVMEVSSHALVQHRVDGIAFGVGVFTNLTQDHLDFHGTLDDYAAAKRMLFTGLDASSHAVINADDAYGAAMVRDTRAAVLRYGILRDADVRGQNLRLGVRGTAFEVVHNGTRSIVQSPLIGRFNVQNILAAYGAGVALGLPDAVIRRGVASVETVRGRFEQIHSPAGWTAIIDYAHTPDALENCLKTIHEILPRGRVISVFGCGGNRDRGKRPLMGEIASRLSSVTIITSDNPRQEDPEQIIEEVAAGVVPGATVYRETDRRKAIARGLGLARAGDVVLIAGKGHETYQVTGTTKSHFDDREEVERYLRTTS